MALDKRLPTLDEYRAFHSMVCPPRVAQRCIDSVVRSGGVFLFGTPGAHARGRADFSGSTGMWSYYLLVLYSLTGLSTLLGLTDEVDAREFPAGDESPAPQEGSKWLRSDRNESVAVSREAIDYCRCATFCTKSKHSSEGCAEGSQSIRLRRRFEYDFRLIGANVIMLHFTTTNNAGSVNDNKRVGNVSLHVVEVYQFRSPLVRAIERVIEEVINFASLFNPRRRIHYDMLVHNEKAS